LLANRVWGEKQMGEVAVPMQKRKAFEERQKKTLLMTLIYT
jgi:hypothetical protein